jgi:cephalosporin hydroxylase
MFKAQTIKILKKSGLVALYDRWVVPRVSQLFFMQLIWKTNNFTGLNWLGQPVWQNLFDLWTTQEVMWQIKPDLLIECGTNRGGSALFYASLFDLMGHGEVVTIDVEKMHDQTHPRVEFLIGSSVSPAIVQRVQERVASAKGPVMVILDSDHSESHVSAELENYAGFVTPGSYLLVQDTVTDTLPWFRNQRPGPLPAVHSFLAKHPEYEMDRALSEKLLISHHPQGWLRRRLGAPTY